MARQNQKTKETENTDLETAAADIDKVVSDAREAVAEIAEANLDLLMLAASRFNKGSNDLRKAANKAMRERVKALSKTQ